MENKDYLNNYYLSHDEDSRLLSRRGQVEFLTTMRYIEKYLFQGARIIEIGAATGRYSHALARMGYEVDAVELIEHNIELFKTNTEPGEKVTITQGDAIELRGFESETYDVTLLLGPMYHLFTEEDKIKALTESLRVTKKGGIVFSAYCMCETSIIEHCFLRGEIFELIEKDMLDTTTFHTKSRESDLFELYRKEDIDSLRERFDVTQLHYVASDGCARAIRDALNTMDEKIFEMFLKYHFATCERVDLIGASCHTLDIFRKN